jgi:hypothetical protein
MRYKIMIYYFNLINYSILNKCMSNSSETTYLKSKKVCLEIHTCIKHKNLLKLFFFIFWNIIEIIHQNFEKRTEYQQ